MITYTYNGNTYDSFYKLKRVTPNLIFSKNTPIELLNQLGIEIIEVEDNPVTTTVDPIVEAKQHRDMNVNSITVIVDDLVFDGNETAQGRISNAILGWDNNKDTIEWVLADNTIAAVTKEQLQKVLQLSVAEMQKYWVTPYVETDNEEIVIDTSENNEETE